jgi:hypothetical protein
MIVGAITSLMFVGAYYIYSQGIGTIGSQQSKADIIHDVRRCLIHFEKDFRSARILTGTTSETLVELSDNKIIFTKYLEGVDDIGRYKTITYEFASYSEGWGLYRREVDSQNPTETSFKSLMVLSTVKKPGGARVDVGLFPEAPISGETFKSGFIGRTVGYNPFLSAQQNPSTTDRTGTRSLELNLVVRDSNGVTMNFRTHVYPRAVAIF